MAYSQRFPTPSHTLPRWRSSTDHGDPLRRTLSDLVRDPQGLMRAGLDRDEAPQLRHLRGLIGAAVGHLRAQGLPPERMLVEMKRIMMPILARGRTRVDAYGPAGPLMQRIVRWCVEAYYGR
jgi:hypothetical protein